MNHSVLVALLLASLGSCDPAQFKSPLSDPAKPKLEPKLTGTWGGRDEKTEFVFFVQPREDQHLDLLLVGRSTGDGVGQLVWDAFPTTLGGKTYLNLREKKITDNFANKYTLEPTYSLVRYELHGDTLKLAYLPNDALQSIDGGVALKEADSAALSAGVQQLPASAFKHFITLKRFKVP
jgi:hypothetical protein